MSQYNVVNVCQLPSMVLEIEALPLVCFAQNCFSVRARDPYLLLL